MKTPTKFQALVKEANERCEEKHRLNCLSEEANVKHTDLHECPLFLTWARFDVQAYASVEGGQIICEATGSYNGWTNYYKHCFYFLKDGAENRGRFSKAKALAALS